MDFGSLDKIDLYPIDFATTQVLQARGVIIFGVASNVSLRIYIQLGK